MSLRDVGSKIGVNLLVLLKKLSLNKLTFDLNMLESIRLHCLFISNVIPYETNLEPIAKCGAYGCLG